MKLLRPLPFETSLHLSQCLEFRAVAATPSSHNKHKTKSLTNLSKICRRHFCKLVFTWCLLPSNRPALHTRHGAGGLPSIARPGARARRQPPKSKIGEQRGAAPQRRPWHHAKFVDPTPARHDFRRRWRAGRRAASTRARGSERRRGMRFRGGATTVASRGAVSPCPTLLRGRAIVRSVPRDRVRRHNQPDR